MPKRKISYYLWLQLLYKLKVRGEGIKESGAFLLGAPEQNTVTEFICYDDLDPNCLSNGIIEFDGAGYVPLWDYCQKNKLTVLADIHTHPGTWTGQSVADQEHPMIKQKGHIALIVPNYAAKPLQLLKGVGVYEYKGNNCWDTLLTESGLKLSWL